MSRPAEPIRAQIYWRNPKTRSKALVLLEVEWPTCEQNFLLTFTIEEWSALLQTGRSVAGTLEPIAKTEMP